MSRESHYSYANSGAGGPGISWGAVFAGTFVAIATMVSLSLLGAGIGLAAAPAADSAGGLAKGLGIGALVWLLVSGALSFYAGGYYAGRFARGGSSGDGVSHSVVTWAFATTAFMFMLTSAVGGALGGAAHLLGSTAQTAVESGSNVAGRAPQPTDNQIDRARGTVEDLTQQARANAPSRDQVVQKAETAAKVAGGAGIGGFLMMLVELGACTLGGRIGSRRYVVARRHEVHRETASV